MALHLRLTKARAFCALAFLSFTPLAGGAQGTASQPLEPQSPALQATATRAADVDTTGNVQLTLPQVRGLAVEAIRRGENKLAVQLADGLLKADPKSSFAYYTRATAQGQMGQTQAARRSAARAYRFANSALHRFEAAELAARLSYADERPTLTQLWLRRAVQNAPNEQVERQLGQDYGVVRSQNPLSFSLRGGLRPSSNVNNGANSAVQIIDGQPEVGTLSGSAQALSGVVATLDGQLRYRLRGTKRSRTEIGSRLYVRRVTLSSEARAMASDLTQGDLGSTFAEVNLRHDFAIGTSGSAGNVTGAIGQFWNGHNKSYGFARLQAGRDWALTGGMRLSLGGLVERRLSNVRNTQDATSFALTGGLSTKRGNGDRLSLSLNLRHTDSETANFRYSSATLSATYALAERVGPAQISASIAAGYTDYPDYSFFIPVPGGRQDKSLYANINFFFPDLDYAGFAPKVTVTAGRKFSNVSRFETEELSVSLGIQSKF